MFSMSDPIIALVWKILTWLALILFVSYISNRITKKFASKKKINNEEDRKFFDSHYSIVEGISILAFIISLIFVVYFIVSLHQDVKNGSIFLPSIISKNPPLIVFLKYFISAVILVSYSTLILEIIGVSLVFRKNAKLMLTYMKLPKTVGERIKIANEGKIRSLEAVYNEGYLSSGIGFFLNIWTIILALIILFVIIII